MFQQSTLKKLLHKESLLEQKIQKRKGAATRHFFHFLYRDIL